VSGNKIFVTRPSLPDLEEFIPYLEEIWEKKWLTNQGDFHREFEQKLAVFLGVPYCNLFTNGTLALLVGLQALRITGEVITTPYSFVATTHALHWNGIKPVFCDIEENSFNIDPSKVESLITNKTTAILPVHVYGNPVKMDKIQEIADIYGLKVIYDAAQAFNVKINNESILANGDMSILSFHATKVFTTFEGGAIVHNDPKLKQRIDYLKNFGFANETTVVGPGINAKMNEFQAALGLLQLKYVEQEIEKRKRIALQYRDNLQDVPGITFFEDLTGVTHNYSYFPILIDEEEFGKSRDDVYSFLKNNDIYTRRYFYPLISNYPVYRNLDSANKSNLPVAEKLAQQILCLPIYGDLTSENVDIISELIVEGKIKKAALSV